MKPTLRANTALLTLALLLLPALAPAQCYTAFRDAGKTLVQQGKYDEAIAKFQRAKNCKTDKPANGDAEMDALIADARSRQPKPKPKPAGPTAAQKRAEAAARKADDDAWDIARGTLTGCQRYLKKYPSGRHAAEARQYTRDYSDDDQDGVLNKDDRCADKKGPASNNGCPSQPQNKPENATPLQGGATPQTDPTKCPGCPEMVSVQGGPFTMGCKDSNRDGECFNWDKPTHIVTMRDFYIGKYEVTVEEFKRFIDKTNHQTDAEKEGWSYVRTGSIWEKRNGVTWRDDAAGNRRPESEMKHPVIHVSWNDAVAYCNWLSRETGNKYRLPTEAEWEYAARGGAKSRSSLYSGSNTLDDVAWHSGNSGNRTHTVGTKKGNELDLHDMSGNVWEWVEDDWHDNFTGAPTDGRAWVDSPRAWSRVARGGCWLNTARYCRAASRANYTPADRHGRVGFRLALQF